jgi:hypothetical protein
VLTELTNHPAGAGETDSWRIGSLDDEPPAGPNVQTTGVKVELQPRGMVNDAPGKGAAKRVATAAGEATAAAAARFPSAHAATRASAAASAVRCGEAATQAVVGGLVRVEVGADNVVSGLRTGAVVGRPPQPPSRRRAPTIPTPTATVGGRLRGRTAGLVTPLILTAT